ncbi:MAG: fibronectin type III domain-containing protein, partial [Methanomassiliicoccales archaeon]
LAPAFEGGSRVDNYVIYQDGVALTTLPQTTNAAIGGLQNGRTYSFAVAAHNAAGLGPFSASATVLPYTAPDAPRGLTAVAGEAMVSLTWIAPAFDGGRTVDYYVVYQDGVALPSPFTTTSANISLLRNGQTYAFAVVAHNAAGNGTRSGSVSATPVAPPGVPSGVTLVVDGNKIVINWTAPEDGGSPILYYRVFRGGAGHDPAFIANATGTTYVDSNVSAGGYVYAVGAVTALGEGVSSVWVYANITSGTDNTALYLGAAIAACAAIGLAVVVLRRKG